MRAAGPCLALMILMCMPLLSFAERGKAEYAIESANSKIEFKVRNHATQVTGRFEVFEGTILFDPESLGKCKATAEINAGSVNTENQKRDNHLMGEDFFKIYDFPSLKFESTCWEQAQNEGEFRISGNLTILGISIPVILDTTFLGESEDRRGKLAKWHATTIINRTDWGITYGPVIIGKKVEISLEIQARQH